MWFLQIKGDNACGDGRSCVQKLFNAFVFSMHKSEAKKEKNYLIQMVPLNFHSIWFSFNNEICFSCKILARMGFSQKETKATQCSRLGHSNVTVCETGEKD